MGIRGKPTATVLAQSRSDKRSPSRRLTALKMGAMVESTNAA
ncbi:hypothetical protein [Microcoleus sp. FACHB-1515]|nr:hypothetical protein [Microcoleus sp. FACHB-1515]